ALSGDIVRPSAPSFGAQTTTEGTRMAQRAWDFVDRDIRCRDVIYFALVAAYLGLVYCYLVCTRRIQSGVTLAQVTHKLGQWLRPARAGAGKVLRVLHLRRDGQPRQAA